MSAARPVVRRAEAAWINGNPDGRLDRRDRGLQYGDGLFETMRVKAGRVRLLEYHLDRLFEGCERLAIAAPSRASVGRELELRARPHADAVMKLILTRGPGARGYRPSGREHCTRVLSISPAPSPGAAETAQRVRVCATPASSNPALAGLKSLNRLDSVLARAEWRDARIWEGLMRDQDGHVVCGTMSNVFVRHGAVLATPLLDRGGIAGVMRRWVLEQAKALRLRVRERRIALEHLEDAAEVFMTNAVAGIVSAKVVEHGRRRMRMASSETAARLRTLLERVA